MPWVTQQEQGVFQVRAQTTPSEMQIERERANHRHKLPPVGQALDRDYFIDFIVFAFLQPSFKSSSLFLWN